MVDGIVSVDDQEGAVVGAAVADFIQKKENIYIKKPDKKHTV
jgi:hypothetical protein